LSKLFTVNFLIIPGPLKKERKGRKQITVASGTGSRYNFQVMSKKISVPPLLFTIISLQIINLIVWLNIDQTYLIYDSHHHFLLSLSVFDEIKSNLIPLLPRVLDRLIHYRWHGVLIAYLTAPFYFLTGISQDSGVLVNSAIFITILILSTYGIAKNLAGKKAGILAAFIISAYPLIFNHLKVYMLDLPLTATVSLAVYFMIKSKLLSSYKHTFLFFISTALGLLIKSINFLGMLAAPFLLVLFKAIKSAGNKAKKITVTATGIAIIAIFTFPFLKLKIYEIWSRLTFCSWLNPAYSAPHGSTLALITHWLATGLKFILWSIQETFNNSLSPLFSIIFFLGLISFIRIKIKPLYKKIIYLWLIAPLLLLGALFYLPKDQRYLMPILPAMAIVSAIAITNISHKKIRNLAITIIVIFGILQQFAISYGFGFRPKKNDLIFRNSQAKTSAPSRNIYPSQKILSLILKHHSQTLPYYQNIFFLSPSPNTYEPMAYLSAIKNYPFYITSTSLSEETSYQEINSPATLLNAADYLVMLEKMPEEETNEISEMPQLKSKFILTRKAFKEKKSDFSFLGKVLYLSENNFLIFKRKKKPVKISKDSLSLYFRDGFLHLLSKKVPLLASTGAFGKFKYKNKTFSTTNAKWSITGKSENSLEATAAWPGVPIKERWGFYLKDSQTLIFTLDFIVNKGILLKQPSFALIFPHFYKQYRTNGKTEHFHIKKVLQYSEKDFVSQDNSITINSPYQHFPKIKSTLTANKFKIKKMLRYNKRLRWINYQSKEGKIFLPKGKNRLLSLKINLK
jgi:4-amino-4-deoxy-L-arabinose transferase-like glycosyltransferase